MTVLYVAEMTAGVIRRIEIEGQFDPSNPCVALTMREPCRIRREQLPLDVQPPNWNDFCNDIDVLLQRMLIPRKMYLFISAITAVLFIFALFGQFAFRNFVTVWIGKEESQVFFYTVTAVIVTVVFFIVLAYWKMRQILSHVFNDVREVGSKNEITNVVKYTVGEERWGYCSKYNSTRRFLNVNIYSHENDLEQQATESNLEDQAQIINDASRETYSGNQAASKGSYFSNLFGGMN